MTQEGTREEKYRNKEMYDQIPNVSTMYGQFQIYDF